MSVSRLGCYVSVMVAVTVAGCAPTELPIETRIANALPAAAVQAKGETEAVATANADAADDPAIWRNAASPSASLIVGTDKKAGLHVYDLTGRDRHFIDAGRVNNVDLIEEGDGVLVVASDRNDLANAKLALFSLDTATAQLKPLGTIAAGTGEAYGVCLGRIEGVTYAFIVVKDGTIRQIALDMSGGAPAGRVVRTMKLATQSEGCAVDPRTNRLYVAEEDAGLYRFDARATGPVEPVRIATADGKQSWPMRKASPSRQRGPRAVMLSSPARGTMPTRSIVSTMTPMSAAFASPRGNSVRPRRPMGSS